MLAVFRGPLGKIKKEKQAGEGPRLLWSCMSPGGVAGAAREDGRLHSTVAMLCASWAPVGPQESTVGGEGALHVPSKAAWFVSWEMILGQPHSRCYWHPSLNLFVLKTHIQKPSPSAWLPSAPPVPNHVCVHLVLVVCAPSSSPPLLPWHCKSNPDPSHYWDL